MTAGQLKGLKSLTHLDLSFNQLKSIGGDMLIESPGLQTVDLSGNTNLSKICRSSFVRHEHLQQVNLRDTNVHYTLRRKFCLEQISDCEGTLLTMQRLLMIFGENSDFSMYEKPRPILYKSVNK